LQANFFTRREFFRMNGPLADQAGQTAPAMGTGTLEIGMASDEAFRDLLHKHGRPTDLKSALRESAKGAVSGRRRRQKSA
jgi:hypothetical protein